MDEFTPKKIIFDGEMTEKLLTGVKYVADAVTRTMGPHGQLVMFEDQTGIFPVVTKDGVSVASMIALEDPAENMGAQFVIQACRKQVEETGDGTTLTALLSYKLYEKGLELIKEHSFREVIHEYHEFELKVVSALLHRAIRVKKVSQLKDIARVAINGDYDLADKIAEAVFKVGKYGMVLYSRNHDQGHVVEYEKGYKMDYGIQHQAFCNEEAHLKIKDPYILVTNRRITDANQLRHVLSQIQEVNPEANLIIVSPTIGLDVLQVMVKNITENTGLKMVHIRPCDNYEPKKNQFILEDIAAATGAMFISEESGQFIQNMDISMLGTCEQVTSNQQTTFFYGLNKKTINVRLNILKSWPKDDDVMKSYIEESMAKLTCGLAIVKVGGKNFTETMEVMARVDDAIRACKSAQEMGYVRGGGVELAKIGKELFDMPMGMANILLEPISKILNNAHPTTEEFTCIIDGLNVPDLNGYDIHRMINIPDMYDIGIVDPVKVLVFAFKNAISVAVSMLKTSVMIIDLSRSKK